MSDSLSSLYGGRGIALARGDGGRVFDTDGREYVDCFNGHGATLFGHAVPELREAVMESAKGVWSCGAGVESDVRDELAELLSELIGGDGRVFLTNSGTEAIEAALKLAAALRPGRGRLLACRRSFHGRTCGALAVTFNPKYRAPFANLIPKAEYYSPSELAEHIDGDTAAVIVEPVQGEGGVHPLDAESGRAITAACERCGALLIADEVQTGLGRCGAPLASPLAGLSPHVTCVAKGLAGGLPAGATVWRREIGDFPAHSHGSTYGGNEFTARVSVAALKLLKAKNLSARAAEYGGEFLSRLAAIKNGRIKAVRGLGLLCGVELDVQAVGIVRALQAEGVLSLTAGPLVLRFLPSFASSIDDMEIAAAALEKVLAEVSK